jgi:CMP-N,N'-diacetyllegionaminic acid synthase
MKKQNYYLNKKKIPCIILARKGSKSLKSKNIVMLNKKPLILHSIEYAKKSKYISHVVVSTDDLRVYKLAKKNDCFCIYPRPKKYSTDTAKTESALLHALKAYEKIFGKTEFYAYLQTTEPFRPKDILDRCIKNLLKDSNVESSFAGYEMHKNFWEYKKNKLRRISDKKNRSIPRQKKKIVYREDTGVALASKSSVLKKYKERIGTKIKIEPYNSLAGLIDIHTSKDLKLAEQIKKLL